MSEYKYPTTDYDRPKQLLALLGTFWAEFYHGRDQVKSIVGAKGQIENQTIVDLMQVLDSFAHRTCPIFKTDNWYVIRLLKSEVNIAEVSLPNHDGSISFNAGRLYDVPVDGMTYAFPVDSSLKDAGQIFNRFTEPSLSWTPGMDYLLEPGRIVFREDPFDDGRIAKRFIYDDGEIVDEEAVLWMFKAELDYETLYRQYGYVLNMRLKSSRAYRDLLTAFFDALVGGTAAHQIIMAASAITGIPVVLEPEEVVEHVTVDSTGRLIITDQHSYKYPEAALPDVSVGDVVHAGDSLVDSLEVIELNQGEVPDDLLSLALGRGFLATCYYGDLIFENKEVPLEVDADHPSGFTFVKFGLGGFPLDVERFFDDLHERGIAESQKPVDECAPGDTVLIPGDECDGEGTPDQRIRRGTLAHLLDVRENPIGEPTAASLPDSINPLEFLVQNVLRANATLLRVRAAGMGSAQLGLHVSTQFRKITPPHTALILIVELTTPSDSITVDMIDEELSTFTAMNLDDPIEDMVDEAFTIKVVSGTCQ